MKKPVFPRILLFLLLYLGVFIALVYIQFSKQGSFTQKAGSFVVSGRRRLPEAGDPPSAPNEYLLEGDTHVFFGGIDFGMIGAGEGHTLLLTGSDGTKEAAVPERMRISGESAVFTFPGGTELEFSTQYSGGALLMLISGVFPEDTSGIELPFKPMRKAGISETGEGHFIVSADGVNYSFDRSPMDANAKLLYINAGGAPISYRVIPEHRGSSPDDFILPQALTDAAYNEAINRWRDQNFSQWSRTISEQTGEDAVLAFAAEALARGTYKAAVAAIPAAFLRSPSRTHESSVYLGGLDQASRSLNSRERERMARLSRLINEKSLEFLKEPNVIRYFAVRGHFNFMDAAAELVRTIDPAILALDITPGILEGYLDWNNYRPNQENPFERLVNQDCFVVLESLTRTSDESGSRVFTYTGNPGDTEFNLRLGKALLAYAETLEDNTWTGIGRSLILSALSMDDVSAARLYRILNPMEDTYPKSLAVVSSSNIWAWTTAQSVSASQQNDELNITVRFPSGESHYMLIQGILPFARIQLYGMDFRTDPQFERYDSSGWAYNSQEQTLLVKMKHRTAEEQIRIIFREAPRPVTGPETEMEAAPAPLATDNTNTAGEARESGFF